MEIRVEPHWCCKDWIQAQFLRSSVQYLNRSIRQCITYDDIVVEKVVPGGGQIPVFIPHDSLFISSSQESILTLTLKPESCSPRFRSTMISKLSEYLPAGWFMYNINSSRANSLSFSKTPDGGVDEHAIAFRATSPVALTVTVIVLVVPSCPLIAGASIPAIVSVQ